MEQFFKVYNWSVNQTVKCPRKKKNNFCILRIIAIVRLPVNLSYIGFDLLHTLNNLFLFICC